MSNILLGWCITLSPSMELEKHGLKPGAKGLVFLELAKQVFYTQIYNFIWIKIINNGVVPGPHSDLALVTP